MFHSSRTRDCENRTKARRVQRVSALLPIRNLDLLHMKVIIKEWHAVAQWQWDTGRQDDGNGDGEEEEDVCGICRNPFEGCCPTCKVPGDDCPLSVFSLFLLTFRRVLTMCSMGRV